MLTSNYTRRSGCVGVSPPPPPSSSSTYSRPKFIVKQLIKQPRISSNYSQVENVAFGRPKRFKVRRINSGGKMDLLKKQRIPDYTDTAYKEAVSKLKYLLAESYTPRASGRHHHDKNSYPRSSSRSRDLDLQSGVSESTSSPEKIHPQVTSILTPANDSQRELTTLVMRQEEYIEQLEQESRYCKDELKNLLSKIRKVVAENELLHDKNKMALLKGFLNEHDGTGVVVDDNCDNDNNDDKKIKKFDSLRSGSSTIMYESRISELEAQLTQCKIELKKSIEDNETSLKIFNDKNRDNNNDTMEQILREKRELNIKLDEATKNLQLSREREIDAVQKVKNIIENKQQIEFEKNQVDLEIRRLKDELERQRDKIREVGQENCRKLAEERHEVERRYGQQVEQLSADVATHWDVASKSQLEIEKQRREIFDLKRELGQKQAIIDDLKKELLSKISALQSDLYQMTTEKDSLEQEVATAKLAVERSERHARQEQSRWQSEINSYKQRIERADADIVHCRRENLRLSEQISSLEKELNMSKMMRSSETPSVIISTQSKTDNDMTGLIKNMEAKHAATVGGLENTLSKQALLVSRLTAECQILTQHLEANNRTHKEQMVNLQTNIEYLSTKIRETFAHQQKAQEKDIHPEIKKVTIHEDDPSTPNNSVASSPPKDQESLNEKIKSPEIARDEENYEQENNENYENYPTEYGEQDYTQYEQYDPSIYHQDQSQEVTGDDNANDFHQYENYSTNDYNVDNTLVPSQSVSQSDQQ